MVGHAANVHPGACGGFHIPPGTSVDFEYFEKSIAVVALELGAEDSPVRNCLSRL